MADSVMGRLRMSCRTLSVITGLFVSAVFILAGIAKLDDPTDAIAFVTKGLNLPVAAARLIVPMVAVAELFVAGWLAFDCGRSSLPGRISLGLVALLAGLLVSIAEMHPQSDWTCGCFGSLQAPWGGRSLRSQLDLNLVLALALLIHLASLRSTQRQGDKAGTARSLRASHETPTILPT